jgi:WhiB family redox-sensing transcriptional regulator
MDDPRAWLSQAACRGVDASVFFVESRRSGPSRYREAEAICARCSVVAECRAEGDEIETAAGIDGFRGGESPTQRRHRRQGSPRARRVAS